MVLVEMGRPPAGSVVLVRSDDVPDILSSVTELAASDTGGQGVVADGNGIVLELVGESIRSLGHSTDEDTYALLGTQILHVVSHSYHRRIVGEGDFAAVRREVVGDGVLDDLEQLLLRGGGADGELVEQLNHQTGEALEGTRNADGGRDFNEDALSGVDVDLKLARLVQRRVEEGEQTLSRGQQLGKRARGK